MEPVALGGCADAKSPISVACTLMHEGCRNGSVQHHDHSTWCSTPPSSAELCPGPAKLLSFPSAPVPHKALISHGLNANSAGDSMLVRRLLKQQQVRSRSSWTPLSDVHLASKLQVQSRSSWTTLSTASFIASGPDEQHCLPQLFDSKGQRHYLPLVLDNSPGHRDQLCPGSYNPMVWQSLQQLPLCTVLLFHDLCHRYPGDHSSKEGGPANARRSAQSVCYPTTPTRDLTMCSI